MTYNPSELVININLISPDNYELIINGRSIITGRMEPVLTVVGDKEQLINFKNRIENRIDRS